MRGDIMKPTREQQQALLGLINRVYQEIRTIEEANQIRARVDDFRPRIDYFHDAIIAYTQNQANGFERAGRLSVESLAQDAVMLRQIQQNPRLMHPDLAIPLSASTEVAERPPLPMPPRNRLDVGVIGALSEGYAHYALLFVALLAQPAERNFMNRTNECHDQLEQVLDLVHNAQLYDTEAQINMDDFLTGITDPELRQHIMMAIVASKQQKHASNREVLHGLQMEKETIQKRMAALDSIHMRFASSQLILFQEGQKLVKKLAAQGFGVVGEFVQQAVREAERGGRGI